MSTDEQVSSPASRWSSLSSRLALLIAVVLVLSGLVTAVYSALAARSASAAASEDSMANAHLSTELLINQAYEDQKRFRDSALAARKAELKNVSAPIIPMLDQLKAAVGRGELTLEQAQAAGLEAIKAIRFRDDDYFFAYNQAGVAIAHPNAKFQSKNLFDMQDPSGVYVIRDLLRIAKDNGADGGYLDYQWVKLNEEMPSPKVGYAFEYAPWNWMIGTGVYVDDIDKEAAARLDEAKAALGDSFAQLRLSDNGVAFVLDKDGKVVVAPPNRDLTWLSSTSEGASVAAGLVAAAQSGGDAITQVVEPASFTGTSETWVMDASRFDPLGWTVVSAVPESAINAAGNAQALRQALLSLGVLVLGLLIGLLASRRIVRPVETMTKAAVALEQDRFDPSMLDGAANRRDEVGTLARAFQRMGTEIVERERKLREQVKKLTVVIDRQKVSDEAGAIADSDFFKELSRKKDDLRARTDGDVG